MRLLDLAGADAAEAAHRRAAQHPLRAELGRERLDVADPVLEGHGGAVGHE
jgi:hypothetical protein